MTAPALAPAWDLSPAARVARHHAKLRAIRLARRDAHRRSAGNPHEFRRIMTEWWLTNRTRP